MTSSFYDQIEKRKEQLRRKQEELAEVQQRLAGVQATATSKNHAITVTVDSHGEIVDIKFRTGAYRLMPGAELSRLLMDTIAAARSDAKAAVMDQFEKVLPDMPIRDLMEGRLDFGTLMSQRIGLPDDWADEPATMPMPSREVDR
jgi:DNA-binding protein YbaB